MKQEFEGAFEAWLASEVDHIKRETSREVYRAIWSSFARDLPPDVSVLEITSVGKLVSGNFPPQVSEQVVHAV